MAKTRSQTGNITVKKEEEEEDCKPYLRLGSVRNTRSSDRISKRTPLSTNNRRLPAQQVKLEENADTKPFLQSPSKYSKLSKQKQVSQEQINRLIRYIVNDNMSIRKASQKVKISQCSGSYYYNAYKSNPEKKIPLPRNQHMHLRKYYTQEQIGNLIKYITQDKMAVTEASAKANIPYYSGNYYYAKYLNDPNHNIPIPHSQQSYTQEQKETLLGYIINDKMSIKAASKKAKMNHSTAQHYYHRHFKKQNPDIPAPSHIATHKRSTQQQLNKAIIEAMGYIINDKMSIRAASIKANICHATAGIHYRQCLKDNNMKAPVKRVIKRYTQDQINEFRGYIVDDKMAIRAASKKATTSESAGYYFYRQYLKEHNLYIPRRKQVQEQMDKLIGYIVDDKMFINAASKKANVPYSTAQKYYRQYLNHQKRDGST